MKKFFLLATAAILALASCDEDVPSPINIVDPSVSGSDTVTYVAEGTGTEADPFNVLAAIAKCKEVGTTLSTEAYYIKGIVKSVNEGGISSYGNINVDMVVSAKSSDVFVAWQILSFGGQKFTESGVVKAGDTIVVKGKIYNYNGSTPETEGKGASVLISVNGKTGSGTTPDPSTVVEAKGTSTEADPFNVAAAVAKCKEVGETLSSEAYYIKGLVKSVNENGISQYGNINVDMIDMTGSTEVFTAFQILSFGGQKFTAAGVVNVGDTIVVKGKVYNYKGNTPETEGKGAAVLISVNGKKEGNTTPDPTPEVVAKGTGTEADPFNIAAAIAKCKEAGETATTDQYYVQGIANVVDTAGLGKYGNISIKMVDATGSTSVFTAFQIYNVGGVKFDAASLNVKAGDTIVVKGALVNYKGNTPETTGKGAAQLVSVKAGNASVTPDPDPAPAGDGILAAVMASYKDLVQNGYGKQATATDSTWLTWTYNGMSYKGAKVCKGPDTESGTIQVQGEASDAAKQGFIFNAKPFASDINTVTVVLKVRSTSSYDPSYSFYAGTAAHPTSDVVTSASTKTAGDGVNIYTQVFDLSAKNCKYFSIVNDKKGAIYIDSIVVTLK